MRRVFAWPFTTVLAETEAARDAALTAGNIYADTTAGLAATAEGDYFTVPSAESDEQFILYRKVGGAASEVKRYPETEPASETTAGLVTTAAQTFAGLKTFVAGLALSAKLHITDTTASESHALAIDHYADGLGATSQTYAIDIHNWPDSLTAPTEGTGAQRAIVVHQYSDAAPAFQIDNTRSQAAIVLKNTQNDSHSAGTYGTGDFFQFVGYSDTATYPTGATSLGGLDQYLAFRSYDASRSWAFITATSGPSLKVQKLSGASGDALQVTQGSAGAGLRVTMSGAESAVVVTAQSGAAGFFPLLVSGQNYGPKFSTSASGGTTLTVQRDNAGAGTALSVVNKGTGKGIVVSDASGEVCSVASDGQIEVAGAGKGIVLKSPDGTRYRLTVANGGTLSIAAA